jgi:ABC-type antimicrobial peptide transport system permease subunit
MTSDMAISLLPARLAAGTLAGFGAVALLLAVLGVYGVTAYIVGQRTPEIGLRTALGATAGNVLRLMMTSTLRLVLLGLTLGIAAGAGVGALVSSQLYGIGPADPIALAGSALLLLGVAGLGTWVPARRALRIDPMRALRSD